MTNPEPLTPATTGQVDTLPATDRGRRKRAAIVTAAREVFEESGFKDARIADIAKRAGASYGSFYTYFDSKEEVFREVVQEVTDGMFRASRGAGRMSDPVRRIERANWQYVESYLRNARMMAVMSEVAAYDEYTANLLLEIRERFVDRIATGIRRLQEDGTADSKIDAQIAADLLGGMIERFAQTWVPRHRQQEIEDAIPVLTQLWTNGLGFK